MPGPFPNEVWIGILSDVLGTLLLLLSDYNCRHRHYISRSVSKQFKTSVDNIWGSAVGLDDDRLG